MRQVALAACFLVVLCSFALADSVTEDFTATVTSSLNPSGLGDPYALPAGSRIDGSFTIDISALTVKPYSSSNFAVHSAGPSAISISVWTTSGAIVVTSSDMDDSFVEVEDNAGYNFWEVSPLQGATQNSTLTNGSSTAGIWASGVNGYVQTVLPSFFPASWDGITSAYGSLATNVNGSVNFMTFTLDGLTPAASAVPEPASMHLLVLLALLSGMLQLIIAVRKKFFARMNKGQLPSSHPF
jgi:hypothetical protein